MNNSGAVRKIRVVHVLHSFRTGGLEKGVVTLVRHASQDLEHVVCCIERSGEYAGKLKAGTQIVELGKRPGNSPTFIWKLSRRLRALRPDIVHTRNWGGIDGILAARLAGIRSVIHGEHGWGTEDSDGLDRRRIRIRRATARWVREYTCVSKQISDWLRDTVRVQTPLTQVYNGVDCETYHPGDGGASVRARLSLPANAFVVGIVGRLDPIKDHGLLFRAFARMRVQRPNSYLLVVGEGPERPRLQSLAGPGVRLLGNRPDVPDLLRSLDLFVLSSLNEGISNTILEAMATALPVVATRVGGNPELVADGTSGTLFKPGDEETLINLLDRYAASEELRRAHGRSGRAMAIDRFGIPQMVAGYETTWRRVAAASTGNHRRETR